MSKFNYLAKFTFLTFIALQLSSVGSFAATFAEMKKTLPVLTTDHARLYFYRRRLFGAAMSPELFLNKRPIWKTSSGCVMYIDVVPGFYTAVVEENELTFNAYANETKYINLGLRPGTWFVSFIPQLLDSKYGEPNIETLDYCGSSIDDSFGR